MASAPAGFTPIDLVYRVGFPGTAFDSDWHSYVTSNAAPTARRVFAPTR